MSFYLDAPAIYLITRGEATPANFDQTSRKILDTIRVAVEEKVSLIQLREKQLPARQIFELAVRAAAITSGSATRLLINDRADVAVAANADGVHLTANSLSPRIIRDNFSANLIVGVSTHSLEAARLAGGQGADFAVFGSVFETPGKGEPQGLVELAIVCGEVRPFPVIALGGIDENNSHSVIEAGASGFAAIRSLNDVGKLSVICEKLRTNKANSY